MGQKVFLTRKDLLNLGITQSNNSLLRWEAKNLFPRRVRLVGSVAWIQEEVMQWISERIQARENHHYAEND